MISPETNNCRRLPCLRCCTDTNMVLTKQDVDMIHALGYPVDFFTSEQDGWIRLKNSDHHCVFHTGDSCSIYEKRPVGCRLYPIVYNNDEKRVLLDTDCPLRKSYHITPHTTKKLKVLVKQLFTERSQRLQKKP